MKRIIFAAITTLWTGGIAVAEVWTGSGSLFDGNRNFIATYDLRVNIETSADGSRTTAIEVSLPDGSKKVINCQSSGSENKWSKTCDDGMAGGGYYFEKGLVSEYVENAGGTAHATTVIFDSDDSMRLLRTELSNGDATRFFVESLTKVRGK